jgi:hypothetical protein
MAELYLQSLIHLHAETLTDNFTLHFTCYEVKKVKLSLYQAMEAHRFVRR